METIMKNTSHIAAVFALIVLAMILAACQPGAATETQQAAQTMPTLAPTETGSAAIPSAATSVPAATTDSTAQSTNASSGDDDLYGAPDDSPSAGSVSATPDPVAPTPDPDPVAPTPDPVAPGTSAGASDEVKMRFQNTGSLGQILVDERGMTLYRFTNDTPNVSNCSGQCAVNWPPLLVAQGGEVEIDDMDEEGLIATITRADGSIQVTYKGQPLYYWINDTRTGDTTGQNVNGVWFVVNP